MFPGPGRIWEDGTGSDSLPHLRKRLFPADEGEAGISIKQRNLRPAPTNSQEALGKTEKVNNIIMSVICHGSLECYFIIFFQNNWVGEIFTLHNHYENED